MVSDIAITLSNVFPTVVEGGTRVNSQAPTQAEFVLELQFPYQNVVL